ncbi:filamentous hemagglutinin family protein [Variovorax sp. OAS795]|uniref:beta strand repeat-containing protein n=1 Tax=Variovorax sp. OAS795 TaxID=3034231 RepID=UPI0033907AEA
MTPRGTAIHLQRRMRLRPLALSLACMGLAPALAQTLPTGFAQMAGNVCLAMGGACVPGMTQAPLGATTLNIMQNSPRAVAQWQTFGVPFGSAVVVTQPSASSVLLNRVVGGQESRIMGSLSATGHVYLINPSGVLFGAQSSVSVGGLVASTLDIAGSAADNFKARNDAFMAGGVLNTGTQRMELTLSGSSPAGITVEKGAQIVAGSGEGDSRTGGLVALVGANVSNSGTINVARGTAGLVSGNEVVMVVDPMGDGLTTFRIPTTSKAATALVENTADGTIRADGGRIQLLAQSVNPADVVVNQGGVLQARSLTVDRGGEILLGAPSNAMRIAGTLDVTGTEAGVTGGSVQSVSDRLRVDGASIDASGSSGGSVTLIGGTAATMSPDAVIRANATVAGGTGGRIGLGGDGTHLSGRLEARGLGSGAGGNVTLVAGIAAGSLEVAGDAVVDASGGESGANGKWRMVSGPDLNVVTDVPAYDPAAYPVGGLPSRVSAQAIGGALGRGTDVVLESSAGRFVEGRLTTGGFGVVFDSDAQVVKSEGRASTLTVNSLRSIGMSNGSSIRSTAGALNVDFNADSKGTVPSELPEILSTNDARSAGGIYLNNASIESGGGDIRFYGQTDPLNGRARGDVLTFEVGSFALPGVGLTNSTLSTCAVGTGGACGGTGLISLRGHGETVRLNESNFFLSGVGVGINGGSMTTGAGGISIDGRGGIGSAGVVATLYASESGSSDPVIRSGTGGISLVGSSRSWATGDPVGLYRGQPDESGTGLGGGIGVILSGATVATGGNVRIDGVGGNVLGLTTAPGNAEFLSTAGGATNEFQVVVGSAFSAGDGVAIRSSSIAAGSGGEVSVAGTAGSKAFTIVNNGAGTPVVTQSAADAFAVNVVAGTGQGLAAEGGRVSVDGRGGDVSLRMGSGFPVLGSNALLSVASGTGQGGTIGVTGRNVVIEGYNNFEGTLRFARLDANGAAGGGTIDISATNALAVGQYTSLEANVGGASGDGGSIRVIGGATLRSHGGLSARAGTAGGNGGAIETSAPLFDLSGVRVDASAPAGTAGTWTIDPYNVAINHGTAAGTLPGNPFDPVAASIVLDGDINNALNASTSVTITTGSTGPVGAGAITLGNGVVIDRTVGAAPVNFRLDANTSIFAFDPNIAIRSNTADPAVGALNVAFNAGLGAVGGTIFYNGAIATNGGTVSMDASAVTNSAAITLNGARIDTRTALLDAGPGGAVTIAGRSTANSAFLSSPVVSLSGATVSTATGDVSISGIGLRGSGVSISGTPGTQGVFTTGGNIDIVGVGSGGFSSTVPVTGNGVVINGATVRSVDGDIGIDGLVLSGTNDATGSGVRIANGGLVTSLGAGNIEVTGESQANGAGVTIAGVVPPGPFGGPSQPAGRIDGNSNVVLRAANDGTTDALVIGGTVRAANVLDLRPGGVDAAGNAGDRTASAITLGGTAATGFAVSADEFTRLSAATIVAGSNAHAGNIDVVGRLALASALTLQNGGGGNIQLNGAITTSQLGLVSAGNIGQAADAAITAGTLLARSTGGNVLLESAGNNVAAVGGSAAGRFAYVDADAVTLGPVSVTGFDAASNTPQLISATSMAADSVLVRTLAGDLTLAVPVSSASGTDLVAAARFQNAGGGSIAGANWRVWADTWVGETRGGLAGSGLYPNLYHCAYLGLCTVNVPAGANHFIYAQQPEATVVIDSVVRGFGRPNPLFTYSITGLILGDTGVGFTGTPTTAAFLGSPPGFYAINGSFTSAEGYAVRVVPGQLQVTGLPRLPSVDVVREQPTTWLYDRNIGQAPICFATGPLEGDRAQQGGDLLAREWSRVRSRPNLTSCVDTEKRNGCADF